MRELVISTFSQLGLHGIATTSWLKIGSSYVLAGWLMDFQLSSLSTISVFSLQEQERSAQIQSQVKVLSRFVPHIIGFPSSCLFAAFQNSRLNLLVFRGCNFNFCATEPCVQQGSFILAEPLAICTIHALLLTNLGELADHDEEQEPYLDFRPHSPNHSSTDEIVVVLGEICQVKTYHTIEPVNVCLLRLLFGQPKMTVFIG